MTSKISPTQAQAIKSEIHLRLFLIVLILAMFSLVAIFTASMNATQKNYEFFTEAMRSINDASHPNNKEVVALHVKLMDGPSALSNSDLDLVAKKIAMGLKDSESAFWKAQFLDVFITADQAYQAQESRVAKWEDLRTQINTTLDRNKADWILEIEETKQSFRSHLENNRPNNPLESIAQYLGTTEDTYEDLRKEVESNVLLTLDRAKSTLENPV